MNELKGLATKVEMKTVCEQIIQNFMVEHHGRYTDSVDIFALAKFINLSVIYETFAGNQGGEIHREGYVSLGDTPVLMVEGGNLIYRTYPIRTIVLERQLKDSGREEDYRKLRYACAHECGHWLMEFYRPIGDLGKAAPITLEEQQDGQESREQQANRCASMLLMPQDLVMRALRTVNDGKKVPLYGEVALSSEGDRVVQRMADILCVNYMPMRYRLGELDLYEPHPIQELVDDLLARMRSQSPV